MTWLTLRQYRAALLTSAALLLALIVWMIVVEHDYTVASHALDRLCPATSASPNWGPVCGNRLDALTTIEDQAGVVRVLALALPVALGVVFGASLVAGELEHGTIVLGFTQSMSRTRWLVVRWLTMAVSVVALASAFALVTNWWFVHVQTNGSGGWFPGPPFDRIQPVSFDVTGVLPVAYALFAFALATALGALLRSRSWAGLTAVIVFITARSSFAHFVRPTLAARLFQAVGHDVGGGAISTSRSLSWSFGLVWRHIPGNRSPSSQAYVNEVVNLLCSRQPNSCLVAHGVQFGYYYQPNSHYWAMQWGEAAAFLAAALALFGLTVLVVRRWRAS
jgi:hypothetical protein